MNPVAAGGVDPHLVRKLSLLADIAPDAGGQATHLNDAARALIRDTVAALTAAQAEADRLRVDAMNAAIEVAARDLPYGYEIRVCVERSAGWVELVKGRNLIPLDEPELSLTAAVTYATQTAIHAAKTEQENDNA